MSSGTPKKVLLAQSDPQFEEKASTYLKDAGIEVHAVRDAASALERVLSLKPDLVIVELSGGSIDGTALAANISLGVGSDAHIPLLALSSNGDLVEIGTSLKSGFMDYVVRSSVSKDVLIQKVFRLLGEAPPPSTSSAPATPAAAAPKGDQPRPTSTSQIKVLIVEDDKFLRDLATQKLAKEGFNVVAAVDGEQGSMFAEKEVPDIILLDILLPGIDGFEVLRRIRANPSLAMARVAMLSNFGQREDIEKALSSGAERFYIKANYTLDEIIAEVKDIIASPRPPAKK